MSVHAMSKRIMNVFNHESPAFVCKFSLDYLFCNLNRLVDWRLYFIASWSNRVYRLVAGVTLTLFYLNISR